jgi:hypothetical protein
VVSTRSVDGHTGRLVNDNQIIVFVDDTDRSAGHGRFVAVGGMRDNLAVLDDSISAGGLAVDADQTVIECGPLLDISLASTATLRASQWTG